MSDTLCESSVAEAIHAAICEESLRDHLDPGWPGRCVKAADTVLAALFPQVSTEAELNALPIGSVIVDKHRVARTKNRSGAWAQPGMDPCPIHLLIDGESFTVVHRGGRREAA